MQDAFRSIGRLPWGYIALFNLAALTAFLLAMSLLFAPSAPVASAAKIEGDKRIAFSFDDTPRGSGGLISLEERPKIFLDAMKKAGIRQAVFFANPGRISAGNNGAATLAAYAEAGHLLANHTNNHLVLSQVSAARFLADVDEAEKWLKKQPTYRPWFRYPQLDRGGRNKAKTEAVRAGMKERGLRHGYVTIDGWDWKLETQAVRAIKSGRNIDRNALRDLYVETHVKSAEFSDQLARRALGRAPVQVMLLHDTDLAALYIDDLAEALKAKGWTIVSADEAYADPLGALSPKVDFAGGNKLQNIATARGITGNRWFERNEDKTAEALFRERILGSKVAAAGNK